MGKIFAGPWANFQGKVGNVVGRISQGRTVLSVYQPIVRNPKTTPQLKARQKFSLATSALSPITGFLRYGFHFLDGYKTGNPFSAAVGYNLSHGAIAGTYPNQEFDYSKAKVAEGSLDLPYSPSATADGTTLSITWADNSGLGNAEATDKVMICVLNADKGQSVYNIELADRNERNASFSCPTAWSGDTVNVWLAMRRESTNECSTSTHLGAMPL